MDKIRVRGDVVKLARKRLRLGQKTLAHELGVCERSLRKVESGNGTWKRELAVRLAAALCQPLEEIVFAADGPKLVPAHYSQSPTAPPTGRFVGKQLVSRFDTDRARLVRDAEGLFEAARGAHTVLVEYHLDLRDDLADFASELVALMQESKRNEWWESPDPEAPRSKEILARMRWLLVQLKGNDVLVFVCDHMKHLPESDEVAESRSLNWECQAIIAFAPPQEWGEDSIWVRIDNGQPYIIDWDKPLVFSV